MRVAFLNWTRRRVGGAERYLAQILPALHDAGHDVSLLFELDAPIDREAIDLPRGAPSWSVEELGARAALRAVHDWHPDLIFAHGVMDVALEAQALEIAPALFFAHTYVATCISGTKTLSRPRPVPCTRQFGWECLFHYYPDRCGGLNPMTMLRDYATQRQRLDILPQYRAILTNSEHMRAEYLRQGFDPERVFAVPLPVAGGPAGAMRPDPPVQRDAWTLLFLGRMDRLKGGMVLLDALPKIAASLARPVRMIFAGDGPERSALEREAAIAVSRNSDLQIDFTGWVGSEQLEELWIATDLLVVPSLWPEPFGLVGPEAGMRGVPAVAFRVGGIPEWLTDGRNGCLAPGNPPTAEGLAQAVIRCLRDPAVYARMCEGARSMAEHFNLDRHVRHLERLFEQWGSPAPDPTRAT